MAQFQRNTHRYTTSGTKAVEDNACVLLGILIEVALTGTVTINDGSTTLAILPIGFPIGFHPLEFNIASNLELVLSANDRIVAVLSDHERA